MSARANQQRRADAKLYRNKGTGLKRAYNARMKAQRNATYARPGYTRTGGYYGRMSGPNAPELKFVDTAISDATLDDDMTFYNPMIIAQNDTESGRDGRKCVITQFSLQLFATLIPSTDTATTSEILRMALVVDTQANGAQFAATDLLTADTLTAFNNLANSQRFRVLKKKTFVFNQTGAVASGAAWTTTENTKYIKWHVNLKNLPIEFDSTATTGALTTVRSNYLCLIMQTQNGEILAINGSMRIRFKG